MLTQDDIIYFIITDRFANGDAENDFDLDMNNPKGYHGGDFQGIIDRIPYLQNLGVTALWITPVMEQWHMPQHGAWGYHGYWPYNFEKVDPHLYSPKPGIPAGSKRYLKELVDQLHAAGMKVILDMVVNHAAYEHPALSGDTSTPLRPHWFNQPRGEQEIGDIGSWVTGLPDLKQDEPEVADYFTSVVADWIEETGVDCIRMDTAKNVESLFWQYYKTTVKSKFPDVSLLGEVLDYNIDHISAYQRYFAFDSLFDFPSQLAIEDIFVRGASFTRLTSPFSNLKQGGSGVLNQDLMYTNSNRLVTLLDNHDLSGRFFTRALEASGGERGWAVHTLKLALTLLLTTRGIPQIYYGTELGLEGSGNEHDTRRDMPWHLVGNGLEPDNETEARGIFEHTKHLIKLRKSSTALKYGDQITLYVSDRQYVYLRNYRNDWIIVAMNLDHTDMAYELVVDIANNPSLPPHLKEKIMSEQYVDVMEVFHPGTIEGGLLKLQMPMRSASILMPLTNTFAYMLK